MNKLACILFIATLFLVTQSVYAQQGFVHLTAQPVYKNPLASTEERVTDLLSRMTLKEKVGQLCSPPGMGDV